MGEWKEYKLGEVCSISSSKRIFANEYQTAGIPFYRGKEIIEKQKGASITNELFISKERYLEIKNKYGAPKEGDMLLTSVGTLGIPYIVQNETFYFKDGNLTWFYDYNDINNKYLYYWFLTPFARHLIDTKAIGSTQKALTIETLKTFEILLPPIEKQKRIASILSSLDAKIENNRRINEILEQQAQALFKSWFVDFEPFKGGEFVESELGMIPKGWRVVSLNDMTSKFGTGLNPRKNFKLGEGNNYYVTIKNMGNNRVYLDDKCDKVNDEAIEKINKRSKLQAGDLLFSGIGTIGRVALITETPKNWNTSESVFNLHPSEGISSEFLYLLLLSDDFQNYVKINAQGGVQQGIRMASLKQYQMAIPDDYALRTFDNIASPIVSLIKNNDKEIDRLASLRDTLLPRLMSGELKVDEIEKKNLSNSTRL